jgi:hypothetical protein
MKKQFALMATLWLVLANTQSPALADDWFDKYDHDHDHHWDYKEFQSAHNNYWKAHHEEKRMNDAELRAEFDRRAAEHHGWVDNEGVRDFHHW